MTAGDMYQRPSRAEIAARVNGAQARPEPPAQQAGPLACFAKHLQARMRALGWEQAQLQEHAEITPQTAARAINGTGVSLELAGKIAQLVGTPLTVMLGPYRCGTCHGTPPEGFMCLECGSEHRAADPRSRLAEAAAEYRKAS